MLKIVKVNVKLEIKVDPSDPEEVSSRVYEAVQMALEEEDLKFELEEDEEEYED